MNGYIVGSVADLISNKVFQSEQQKKIKGDLKSKIQRQITDINPNRENVKSSTEASDMYSKIKNVSHTLDGCSIKKLSAKKETVSKIKKNVAYPNETETQGKRKKKLCKEFIPNFRHVTKEKRNKDLPVLDHMPTDSDEDEGLEKKFNRKNASTKQTSLCEKKENTIFVGNIPINYDKQKVCKVFSKFGEIQNARIRCVPVENINVTKKVAAIKKKFNPKRNSLVAYVKYKSQDSANAALKANGMIIDGHHIRVDFAEQNKERDNNKAVFVGGLPFDIEDDELWEFFQNCGEINSVRIIRDSQTSAGKGFGYVNFDSTASVELALQLNGQELKKRTINVKRCTDSRNKNKLNSFNVRKNKEIKSHFLCKKEKKLKEKLKKESSKVSDAFQGKIANMKQKKKKKLSKAALHQRKLVKILGAS